MFAFEKKIKNGSLNRPYSWDEGGQAEKKKARRGKCCILHGQHLVTRCKKVLVMS